MPIYEYKCEGCGEVFEERQKISDPPLKKHATCGSKKVKKLISATSFQLKGEGWYVTDYKKRPSESKSDGGGDTKTSDDSKKSEKKSDDKKPEKKSEGKKSKSDKSAA